MSLSLSGKFDNEYLELSTSVREKEVDLEWKEKEKTYSHWCINSLHVALLHKNLYCLKA